MVYDVFRTNCRGIPGNVDYLGMIEAGSPDEALDSARLLYDHSAGERIEVEVRDGDETA